MPSTFLFLTRTEWELFLRKRGNQFSPHFFSLLIRKRKVNIYFPSFSASDLAPHARSNITMSMIYCNGLEWIQIKFLFLAIEFADIIKDTSYRIKHARHNIIMSSLWQNYHIIERNKVLYIQKANARKKIERSS